MLKISNLLGTVSTISVVLYLAPAVYPCSCADPGVREKFRAAHAVFVGKVVEIKPMIPISDFPLAATTVKFEADKWFKGAQRPEIEVIADHDRPGWCGDLSLTVGEQYLIYARREKGRLTIYADCGPNRHINDAAEDIKRLKRFWFRSFARFYPYPAM